jgi:hypothetical protein
LHSVRADGFAERQFLGQLGDKTKRTPKRKVAAARRRKPETSR